MLDFGIAKLLSERPKKSEAIVGTPSYMAPEQCRGDDQIDARADLYAVGCILMTLLTGRPPFDADAPTDVMAMQIYQPAPRLRDVNINMPPELDALIAKMLAKSPAERTPSAAWALAALERIALPTLTGEIPLMHFGGGPKQAAATSFKEEEKSFPIQVLVIAVMLALVAFAAIAFLL